MNASENVNGSTSDISKQFLNKLSGTVAVITSDGRMIVVRLVSLTFCFLHKDFHGNKDTMLGYYHLHDHTFTCFCFKALSPLFYTV